MLHKNLSYPVIGTIVFLLAVFMVAGASQAQAQTESAGQLQYRIAIDQNLATVRAQQGDFSEMPTALFERSPATGGWQPLEQGDRGSSGASAIRTLGYAMALDGNYAIVGAEWHDGFAGAAYIYKRKGDGWAEPQKLSPPDLGRYDHFGGTVSINGDYAVVGATWQDLFKGAVYVYKRVGSEWVFQEKLTAGDAKPDDQFGYMVRIDGNDITVGTGSADVQDLAYRFVRSGDAWTEQQKVSVSAMKNSGDELSQGLIESVTAGDLLVLAENLGENTEMPPSLSPMAPPPVDSLIATDGAYEDSTVLFWPSIGLNAIIYKIERNGTLIAIASSDDSAHVDDTGDRGVIYEYCVIVTDMSGGPSAPACDSGSCVVFPAAEAGGSYNDFKDFVRLTWTDASEVEVEYRIHREGSLIGTLPADAELYEDSTAVTDTEYLYQIVAVDSAGASSDSAEVDGMRALILRPTDFTASLGTHPDSVKLTWTDNADNEVGFLIIRDEGTLDSIGPNPGTGPMVYYDNTALPGDFHGYAVAAVHSSGAWAFTDFVGGGIDVLPPPKNVVATDSTFDTHVEISWDSPSDPWTGITGLEDGFEIKRDGSIIDTLDADSTFYVDFNASPGTPHNYCVIAYSDSGGRSVEVCDNGLRAIVVAPSEVQATDGEREDRVDITWSSTATTAVLFKIYRDATFIKSVGLTTLSYSDYGATAGIVHDYSVSAVTLTSIESPSVPDTGSRVLRAPTDVSATDDEFEEKVVVSWADNSRLEHGYFIARENTVTSAVDSIWLGANRTSYADWTSEPGVIYDYSVSAFDSLGDSTGFSEIAGDFGRRTLLPPTNVSAADGDSETEVRITWVDNSGAEDGYYIYRNSTLIDSTDDNFTSYVDTSPVFAQTREYGVAAFDAYGKSTTASDSGSTIILAPGSFNASDTYTGSVELIWVDLSSVETGYVITRNGGALTTVSANTTSYTDNTAAASTIYEYCIHAVSGGQTSADACDDGVRQSVTLITEVDLKLLASDGAAGDRFGRAVAISGDHAIVGADIENGATGAAYILKRNDDGTWSEVQKMSGEAASDQYGLSVAISGDRAIVGAIDNDGYKGAAYIYERASDGSWPSTYTKKIVASDAAEGDYSGISVAIDGDVAIVGAYGDASSRGSAYIFERAGTWPTNETKKIIASDAAAGDEFGYSVAISGNYAIVGARGDASSTGSAYIFERSGSWPTNETKKINASDGAVDDRFGVSVAISGGVAIVGAYWDDSRRGSAYIFERAGSWPTNETKKIVASDGTSNDRFGYSVAISGGAAIVGQPYDPMGSAYIFEGAGTWPEVRKLLASDGAGGDEFGNSVAISDGVAIVGASADDGSRGAAYIWPSGTVVASDGSLNTRVRIDWEYYSSDPDGFRVYRDDELIATLAPDVQSYEDFDAQPGRTYDYGVAAFSLATGDGGQFSDLGWRPANGNITGRIATPSGAGVDGISVGLDPVPIKSLLLDGAGGHVSIPDLHETFDFATDSSYTIETWIKYSGNGGPGSDDKGIIAKAASLPFPFILGNNRDSGNPGRLYFAMMDGGSSYAQAISARNDLNDDTWHHVACVHDAAQNKLSIYVDGTLEGSSTYASMGDISNTDDLTLGISQYGVLGYFQGQIDELRIWSVARDSTDIQADMDLPLVGDEDGLVGYWPLDGGNSSAVTDLTAGAHYGTFENGVYWADNAAPIDISGTTDLEGNYSIDRIRYGQETTFDVQPSEGERQFSPAFKAITLSTEHPVENQVNFIETSSFTLAGVVDFPGTNCGAQNIEIHVDGLLTSLTDKNGKFAVAVSYGDHWIKPQLEGRTFTPDSVLLSVEGDLPGVDFSDNTTRTLSGLVGGGCRTPIGDVMIQVRSENDCLDISDTSDTGIFTDYEITLPPQKYIVSASVDVSSIPGGLEVVDVLKFFDNLGDRVVDLTTADSTLDFVYRAPLEVTIEGLDEYIPGCGQLTFLGENLPASLPVIPQGTSLSLQITVNENYGSGNLCPLDSGMITIFDEIFDQQNTPIELVVKDGVASYTSFASTPSLIAGRVDPQGNNRSFQKALRAMVTVEGRTPVTETAWALVTGHVAPEGADFVTAASTEYLSYILRDPPGDESYAFLEAGESIRSRIDYESFSITDQIGVSFSAKFGIQLSTWIGIGAGTSTEISAKAGFSTETLAGHMQNRESGTDVTITTTETFSTSTNQLLAGEGGDLYVGTGFNFIFAEVGVVEVENCAVVRSTSVGFEPDSTATTFAYTHQFINDVLIPEFVSKAAYYNNLGHPDSAAMFSAREANWTNILAYNDSLKQEAEFKINRSFSAGAEFSYSLETDTTKFSNEVNGFVGDFSGDFGQFSFGSAATDFGLSIPVRISTEYIPDMTDEEASRTLTVGYVFSDDDIGDRFTVDIKEDDVYPSPIFEVLAGASSCPWEPWADSSGEARMLSRDKAVLTVGGDPVLNDVPLDEPGVFILSMANLSPTEETREYILRELTTSNPGGAIIEANGAPLSQGISYFINGDPLNNSNTVTLTVERGPTNYSYSNLAVMMYPPCEYALWEDGGALQRSDTLYLSVNFDAPCSDITLYRPEPGWTFNKADQDAGDSLILILTDYEVVISESDTVESVWGEYRRLGVGQEGPGSWVSIPADTMEETSTIIKWPPPTTLADGLYELRAFTKCENGRGYSDVSVGTIDRNAPQVLGNPEPADEELSLGEHISITFNEQIDCGSINADGFLTYLDGPSVGDTIEVDWVCDGTTIIFTPASAVDPDSLEGRLLEARVADVRDLAGNPMAGAEVWTFTVKQSDFTWDHRSIIQDVPFRAPGSIIAELVNGSDATANFNIFSSTWPSWITDVSPNSGSIAPGGTQSISLTLQEDLAMGSYDSVVVAESDQGQAILDIYLMVSCYEPVWEVDPGRYQHSMTIVAEVEINGTYSSDANDRVAAYVGNQLRGVANVDPVESMVFLTVGSNRSWGETVRFQVWDADSCRLYNKTLEHFSFMRDDRIGTIDSPEKLTAISVLPDTVQAISLNQGWNWFSTNVLAVDMSPTGVLSDLTPLEGDIIKSRTAFAIFDPVLGWVGTLQLMDNVSSYMIDLSESGTILQEGPVVDPDSTPIPVGNGWNWIGYLPTETHPVGTALGDLGTNLSDGDMVKSQTAFAQYNNLAWFGDLDSMEAGMGYKLYLDTVPTNSTFNYPSRGGGAPGPPWAGILQQETNREAKIAEDEPGWSFDRGAYQYNMTVIATLIIEGGMRQDEDDMIGAFVDGECRGVARPVYLASIDRYVAFLMIHSNSVVGESVEFLAFVSEAQAVYDIAEAIGYEADAAAGTIREPLVLNTKGVASDDTEEIVPAKYNLSQNYPNPFNPMTTIEYSLPDQLHVKIEVINVIGQRVRTLVNALQPAGRHSIVWDGKNDQGEDMSSGIYFYRLEAGEFFESKKMVILK